MSGSMKLTILPLMSLPMIMAILFGAVIVPRLFLKDSAKSNAIDIQYVDVVLALPTFLSEIQRIAKQDFDPTVTGDHLAESDSETESWDEEDDIDSEDSGYVSMPSTSTMPATKKQRGNRQPT